jgi:leader peptidase (prepilin peptidase) / N-methyltransferase
VSAAVVAYLGMLGAASGSFLDAAVWRLHTGRSVVRGRSECESCHHRLGPADLIPVVSWIALRGRCRYCGVRIAGLATLVEIALAAVAVASALRWPAADWRATTSLVLWLLCLVILAGLAYYDARWLRLPNLPLLAVLPLAVASLVLRASLAPGFTPAGVAVRATAGAALLGGVYLLAFLVSQGRWVGMGDVKLAALVGLMTGWYAGLLALAVANGVGAAVALVLGKRQIPLGPFLVLGLVVAVLFGPAR